MTEQVDELFGDASTQPKPRIALITSLLASGMLMALLGLACTSVPGGLMVLWSWSLVETEVGRIDSGYLAEDWRSTLTLLKQLVWIGLGIIMALFLMQLFLLQAGVYPELWSPLIQLLEPASMSGAGTQTIPIPNP
jgi:hypothetical protein